MEASFSKNRKFRRMIVNILSIVVILAIAFPAAGFALQLNHETARADTLWWQDDFNGESLDPAWWWVNENPAMWNLTENPGFLRIYTSPYPAGGENLLLRSPDAGEFALYTHVIFEPTENFQDAGLVIWQDASNLLLLGHAYCWYEGAPCVGNGIYFDHVENGDWVGSNFGTPAPNPGEAYLRLERRGNTFWGYYSEDGATWTLLGVHQVAQGFTINGIGLASVGNYTEASIAADFDYFAEGPSSEPAPRIVHRYHNYVVAEHFVPDALVTFTAYESQGASEPLFELSRYADETGGAGIWEWEYPYDLVPGNYLVVSDGSITKDLVLEPVTMDVFDPDLNLLAGTTSPYRALYVYAQNDITYCSMDVTADGDGAWAANFNGTCDVTDDMWTAAMAMDEDGDVSEATRPAPPTGYHDYDAGDVPSWACNAGGWAMDPDSPYEDVNVRILADGIQVMDAFKAENYREDLESAWNEGGGGCPGGTCAFEVSLWGQIDSYVPHEITVEAQDLQSGEWYSLNNTPKTLTCRSYDIYTFDPATGTTRQITNLPDMHEFNPRWSPDAKKIVHDAWQTDWSAHGVYITDVKTGVSSLLVEGGSYPTWSPSGKWIAFDRGADNDYRLFIVPPTGGTPKLVRDDAFMASWAPNSQRLAFHQPSDGSIRTMNLNGQNVTLVAERGNGPAWSPDGEWIAFEMDGDVWKVHVNNNGAPIGKPIQLTSSPFWEGRPTWSFNSKTIAFHAGMGQDTDIWTIPAAGGEATWLTGAPNFGDYDPNYSLKGQSQYISYASFSPDGQAPRLWVSAYTYDPPIGTFDEGTHPYYFDFEWSAPEPGSWSGQGGEFVISDGAEIYDGYVLLRGPEELHGINYPDGFACEPVGDINSSQLTRFLIGWVPDYGEISYTDAKAHFESITATAVWDDGSAELARHEIIPFRWDNWFDYVCTFTEAPPKMDLRVNYGHDWVESFYEAGHTVSIQVTDGEGNLKATAEAFTGPRQEWEGATGFQTTPESWSPEPPDLQPYDWVYAQVDNGATAQVQLGEIQGEVRFDLDSVTGTITAPWITDPVQVECLDWGSGAQPPFSNKDGGFLLTNGTDPYSCSWDPETEWDVQPWQDIGVGYLTPDGHWVANAFRDERWMAFWSYTPDPPTGLFEEGEHSYYYQWVYTVPESVSGTSGPRTITIASAVNEVPTPIYGGFALIGPWGWDYPGNFRPQVAWTGSACEGVSVLHPDQQMRFVWGWVNDYSMTYEEALAHFGSLTVEVFWDDFSDGSADGSAPLAMLTDLVPYTGQDTRFEYLCTLTEHP